MTAPDPGRLAAALGEAPDLPGVYLMKDADGQVLYVGKAVSLRKRVRSYWAADGSPKPNAPVKTATLLAKVVDLLRWEVKGSGGNAG